MKKKEKLAIEKVVSGSIKLITDEDFSKHMNSGEVDKKFEEEYQKLRISELKSITEITKDKTRF